MTRTHGVDPDGVTTDDASGENIAGGLNLGGPITGPGGASPSLVVKKTAAQTGYLLNLTDDSDVMKCSVAVDGEVITTDDVLAPTGIIKGATLAQYTSGTGAPSTGAHNQGEFHGDTSGALFYCTVSGTPGTWKTVTLT